MGRLRRMSASLRAWTPVSMTGAKAAFQLAGLSTLTTLLLSLTGCALVTLKSPEKPLSARDLNVRILTHEFAAHFIFAVEQTADEIASGSDTPPHTVEYTPLEDLGSERQRTGGEPDGADVGAVGHLGIGRADA